MNNVSQLLASLSQDKRALLERRLLLKKSVPSPNRSPSPTDNGPRPLSFSQESLWFFDQLHPNHPLFNFPQALRLRGEIDIAALEKSFETIFLRHESLRTNFISVVDQPRQIVAEHKPFVLPVIDFVSCLQPEREPEREANHWLEQESKRPFNLATDLMLRPSLLRLRPADHILFLSIHHISADAWSLSLLNEELTVHYKNFSANQPAVLPEIVFQYGDFAVCQRERFRGEFAAKQIAYWKERLGGELPVLELPTDRPRPSQQTFCGAMHYFNFPQPLLAKLKELSRSEKVTVYSTLLAAFQILLQRYSRQDDILIGSPVATRHRSDTENLIGYFINTVVMRCDLSGNPTFQQLLKRTYENVLGALCHQDVPLERLVEELKVPRHAGRHPLVQILFQYLAEPIPLPEFLGVTVDALPLDMQTAEFDLTMTLRDSADGLVGELEFNTDLFDKTTIERLVGHYHVLLGAIVARPADQIENLPILTAPEEHQLLIEWNDTKIAFPNDATIPALLEKQAVATPDAIALICEQEKLTYRQLNERASRLASHLKKLGAQSDALIGICMERSIEMMVALHGVLKSGAAFLPLDPEYPAERLAFMLQDSQAPVLLMQKDLSEKISLKHHKIILLDTSGEMFELGRVTPSLSQNPMRNAWGDERGEEIHSPHPDDLAYVIYTSGSTGQPKGVMISHDAICNHLFWMQHRFPLSATDRVLQKTSFSFDVAVWELFAPVLTGAALVLAKPSGQRDNAYLVELIREEQITILQTVPSALRALIDEPDFAECISLKYVICGGEEMPRELPGLFASISKAELANNYGPTEAAIDATYWICSREENNNVLPIGKPIANAQVYLLDAHLRLVPIGVPGELCVGGRGLARGYLRQPKLTDEKFIRHPFSNDPAARLYKTGDLARYRPDGNIEFLGRIDHQVKVRGFRIELGEIESVLRVYPGIRDSAVIVRKELSGENRLVAYLSTSSTSSPAETELRAHLRTKLPEFMIPSAFVFLETLPLTPNGKLDRRALPLPNFQPTTTHFVAPRTPCEQELTQMWSEILDVKQVGIHDNFFDLGGHSLLASQLVSRMRRAGKTVALSDFFQTPTVAELGAVLENNSNKIIPDNSIRPLARKKKDVAGARLQSAAQSSILCAEFLAAECNASLVEYSRFANLL